MSAPHRVVIVGGGFGGLYAAKGLARAPVGVTLIDRNNFHLFQPLLYQVATAGLAPGDVASPLRNILRRQANADVRLGDVTDIDPDARRIIVGDEAIPYDSLVVAAGVETHYFGNDHWERWAPGLKTMQDALHMRSRILRAFEAAEWAEDEAERQAWLTFVIVGGGPTGTEVAGTIADIARDTLRGDFRHIKTQDARVVLLEAAPRVLGAYPSELAAEALHQLADLDIEVRTGTLVTNIESGRVEIKRDEREDVIRSHTVLWAAGVRVSPLTATLAERTGAPLDRARRLEVNQDFSLPGYPSIFVVGDMAAYRDASGELLPGLAAVAQQQGRYVAKLIRARVRGKREPRRFRYRDKGMLAIIGRNKGVADVGPLHFAGFPAWAFWLFVHIMLLAGFENRVLVLVQWAFNYFTRNRSTRLITVPETGENASTSDR